jgi:archaellum component FlaG (FlaF/FlaG flagellin family)
MSKGAIAIFALSIFLFHCATPVANTAPPPPAPLVLPPTSQAVPPAPPQPRLLPNLTISDLSLDETGKIEVMLKNVGSGAAPYGIGSLTVYVDGLLKWKVSLGTLSDQTFLEPGGTTLYTTPVELVGKHEVRAVLDKEERALEENESSEVFPKVLEKEKLEAQPLLPNLAVTDLFLTSRRELAVTIANSGEHPLPLGNAKLKVMVDGSLKGYYTLRSLSDQSSLPIKGTLILTTPLVVVGRHEIDAEMIFPNELKESNKENNHLKKILEGPPVGPDIIVRQLELTEDFELVIILSNAGEVDLRKGAIFQIQVFVNDQKMSEFDHFISEALKANLKNRYMVTPPYQVGLTGISRVKVSISPELSSDDINLEDNTIERTFIIFPFQIKPQEKEEFSFSFLSPGFRSKDQTEKVTVEARWEWGGPSLKLSFRKSGRVEGIPTLTGKSPLKVEFSIPYEEAENENAWSVLITNLVKKRVEGYLIIQHP